MHSCIGCQRAQPQLEAGEEEVTFVSPKKKIQESEESIMSSLPTLGLQSVLSDRWNVEALPQPVIDPT